MRLKNLSIAALGALVLTLTSYAQTSSLEGDVKGEDGQPLKGAWVKIERKDIKGNYKVKTDKKGHYFHAGLPLGMYRLSVEVDGQVKDSIDNVRTRLGDPTPVNFDLQAQKNKRDAMQRAAETGQLTQEQKRDLTPEQRAQLEKNLKEREAAMKKNAALNTAFNEGMTALQGKAWDQAVAAFAKAAEMDPKQHVVWAQLAEAYMGQAQGKTGAEGEALMAKGLEAYGKALELKPDDAAYHNNYALALVKAKKIPEAQAELTKAAQINPQGAGQYYYNLGAVLTNTGQNDAAGEAFKKAIEADPNYAEAYYQYGMSLVAKAQTSADGKITPPAGTKEAFEKYIELKKEGQNVESAKAMLTTLSSGVDTSYKNPKAPPPSTKKGKKK